MRKKEIFAANIQFLRIFVVLKEKTDQRRRVFNQVRAKLEISSCLAEAGRSVSQIIMHKLFSSYAKVAHR